MADTSRPSTPAELIAGLHERVEHARGAAADVRSTDHVRQRSGLVNLAGAGYSVTESLKKLSRVEPSLREWYKSTCKEIDADELLSWFARLRRIETHDGGPVPASQSVRFRGTVADLRKGAPPRTMIVRIDGQGRTFWDVLQPDGSLRRVEAHPPEGVVTVALLLKTPPGTHRGASVAGRSTADLCDLYVAYLDSLVTDAEALTRKETGTPS
jgi:hypothetical protein